jgi:dTDP-glucose pyrophosphorylase
MASSEAEYGFIASTAKSILGSSPYLVLPIKQDTKGALATLGWTLSNLPKNCPILVAPSDSLVLCDIDDFVRKMDKLQTDCGIIVFSSSNPEYSYVRTLKETVTEIAEKVIISNKASAGVYYFKDSDILCKCLEWAILNRITTDGNYYLAPALNYLVSEGKLVSTLEINTSEYLRFRTEEEFIESLTRMEGKYENDQY